MQAKVGAAVDARQSPDFLVIARSDAAAVEGLSSALDRARAYHDAGADMIFIEAPETDDDLRRITDTLADVPLLINMVEGGRTPDHSLSELHDMGYRLVLRANVLLRSMVRAGVDCLRALRADGRPGTAFITWEERQELVDLARFVAIEDEARARWNVG